jgi:hypothetical protein
MNYIAYLRNVCDEDIKHLHEKEKTYKDSWKRRGGTGAFMVTARKWDRLENMLKPRGYDVFDGIRANCRGEDGTILAEIRDLRRYLLLIEAEMMAEGVITEKLRPEKNFNFQARMQMEAEAGRPGTPDDGGHHARQDFED